MTEPTKPAIERPPLVLTYEEYCGPMSDAERLMGLPNHVMAARIEAAKAQLAARTPQAQPPPPPTFEDARGLFYQALERTRNDVTSAAALLVSWRQQERNRAIIDVGIHKLLVDELTRLAKSSRR